jgi:DNA-binding NarL/FixJ family response regulator
MDADWIVRTIPGRRMVGASKRDALLAPRPLKLDPDRRACVCALASQGRTLREIGAELGVSHETVRHVLRHAVCTLTGR